MPRELTPEAHAAMGGGPLRAIPAATAPAYGDEWINRLAAAVRIVEAMDSKERAAAFCYLKSRFADEWPS